jgi:TPR repeat protein
VTSPAKSDDSAEEASQPPPARKVTRARAQPATASVAQSAALEAEGEKYLYGNGVPENCTRARTNLLAAAEHSNAHAQNVLGTMYATGHCATRDLPTAYRWFSRSLRKDPSNTRIEQDLKVLWNQMTPEERQFALKTDR